MDQRLVAADAALKAGRNAEAIDLIIAVLGDAPEQPVQIYNVLCRQLYFARRYEEGAVWTGKATERFPKEFDLWNLRGVMLRQLKRHAEALSAYDAALKLKPNSTIALTNKGNVYNDIEDGPRAEAIFSKLARLDPRNAEYQRELGRALRQQRKFDAAATRFKQAITLRKGYIDALLDLSAVEADRGRSDVALDLLVKATGDVPNEPRLKEARASMLAGRGEYRAAEAYLNEVIKAGGDAAWVQFRLGRTIAEFDKPRANVHLRRAVEMEPNNVEYLMALAESLNRTRSSDEAALIDEAYQVVRRAAALGPLGLEHSSRAAAILVRVCAFDEMEALGSFRDLGRYWAATDRQGSLLLQMARVQTYEDRLELVRQHRMWGEISEARAKAHPIRRAPRRPPGEKIRVGFMSSDLRVHPVAYFAMPVFQHVDRERFEVFCYSFYQGAEDAVQKQIASMVTAFRWQPEISPADAAQMIADDDLDILFELGGTTAMNKLEVMAYRPAPRQVSWLGYPHSAGIGAIDYLLTDPKMAPEDRKLLVEKPMHMPKTWITLGGHAFTDANEISPGVPEDRTGHITYGTANNPHKYNVAMLRTWARTVAATPDSKFMFLRPESGAVAFRDHLVRLFAEEGVAEDRLIFRAVRGTHLQHYNEIDITLDSFPLTGGTTTCEALWMGVPVVSLKGAALFERLSYSILDSVGLADHSADDLEGYMAIALGLAGDREKRLELRHSLRSRMRSSPLGQAEAYARDFYALVDRTVRDGAKA